MGSGGRSSADDGRCVVIVSASMGAGHDGVSRELTRRLSLRGFRVQELDLLRLLPRPFGWLIQASYRIVLYRLPASYQWLYSALDRSRMLALLVSVFGWSARRKLLRALPGDLAMIVSTYPLASQLCGHLRHKEVLAVPVATFLTDFSVHRMWVANGVDMHLAVHAVPAEQALALGAKNVITTGPVVRPQFLADATRETARVAFGLPTDRRVALIVAGSWGVGEVEHAAADIAATGLAVPVVVCGRNDALHRRLKANSEVIALSWVSEMEQLLAGADVLVQNAGGLSALEAFACRTPVITYRSIPGHGQTNAAALEQAGLARWVRHGDDLAAALTEAFSEQGRQASSRHAQEMFHMDAAAIISEAAVPSVVSVLLTGRRRRTRLAVALTAIASVVWASTVGTQLAVAHGLDEADATTQAGVYVIAHPRGTLDAATLTELTHLHASVAVDIFTASANAGIINKASAANITIVNAGGGPPYRTGLTIGRKAIYSTAHSIARLTGHPARLFLSHGDVDAIDLTMVMDLDEQIVVPTVAIANGSHRAIRAGDVVLVDCRSSTDCLRTLQGLDQTVTGTGLTFRDAAKLAE